jgi:hypothetical protein
LGIDETSTGREVSLSASEMNMGSSTVEIFKALPTRWAA